MILRCRFLLIVLLILNASCALNDENPSVLELESTSYDFNVGLQGWEHGFADYPVADSASYKLKYAYTTSPADSSKKAIMLSGYNKDNDLFMYLKRRVTNMEPNTIYTLTFEIELMSDAKSGYFDSIGYPGDRVYLKVGAADLEPKSLIDESYFIMNIDKGNGADNGNGMINIGNISGPEASSGFTLINRSNVPYANDNPTYTSPVVIKSNNDGMIWLIVGTDSEYSGSTTVYYSKISVVLSKSS